MPKKYFAKYLPVEGEIKKGDYFRAHGTEYIGEVWQCKGVSDTFGYSYSSATNMWTNQKKNYEKVKLFLCSTDIQVGDKCFIEGGSKNEYIASKDGVQGYFKVIGEISPDVTWVKEGDEFDEDQVRVVSIFTGKIKSINLIKPNLHQIQIKGPCGHFH